MAKNKPTRQHYVPRCYLAEWVDRKTPSGQEAYLWIFNRGERKGKKRAPSNVFIEKDLYTLRLGSGEKSYVIEETLSELEGRYAAVYRDKIRKHLPLTEEEHVTLCAFVSAMFLRTPRHRDNLEGFLDRMIQRTEEMEQANGSHTEESNKLKRMKQDVHRLSIVNLLPQLTDLLSKMSVAFLCAAGGATFVTSDDPCNLFNPDLQWQNVAGPGLGQRNTQVTLPLSPDIMLCLSWSALRGYISWEAHRVEEANRMAVGQCYKYFVSNTSTARRLWLSRYPLDPIFVLRILFHRMANRIRRLRVRFRYRHAHRL